MLINGAVSQHQEKSHLLYSPKARQVKVVRPRVRLARKANVKHMLTLALYGCIPFKSFRLHPCAHAQFSSSSLVWKVIMTYMFMSFMFPNPVGSATSNIHPSLRKLLKAIITTELKISDYLFFSKLFSILAVKSPIKVHVLTFKQPNNRDRYLHLNNKKTF